MKKTLLLTVVFLATISLNAQKIWNMGGDPTLAATSPAFPVTTGIGTGDGSAGNPAFPVRIDGLGITGISTNANMGAVNASAKTFGSYSFVNRFQFNGAGYPSAVNTDANPGTYNTPTQRFLTFNVSGNSTIYAIGVTGSSSSPRKLFVTDGTNFIGSIDFPAATALSDGTVNYTGPATTIYVFCNAAINLTLLSATNFVATSTKSVLADKGVSLNGGEIVNSQKQSLEVYNVLGKKVISSNENVSLKDFQKGIYIVRVAGSNDALKFSI